MSIENVVFIFFPLIYVIYSRTTRRPRSTPRRLPRPRLQSRRRPRRTTRAPDRSRCIERSPRRRSGRLRPGEGEAHGPAEEAVVLARALVAPAPAGRRKCLSFLAVLGSVGLPGSVRETWRESSPMPEGRRRRAGRRASDPAAAGRHAPPSGRGTCFATRQIGRGATKQAHSRRT